MSEEPSHWRRFTTMRLTRRRALAASGTAAAGLAGLSLVGCGSSSNSPQAVDHSGLLSNPVDSTSPIIKGGDYSQALSRDTMNFDISSNEGDLTAAEFAYSRLVKFKAFKFPEPVQATGEGDAAASWESSPDGLTYTFRLRPNMKFDPRPPTNNRLLNSGDVKFSWDRFVRLGTFAPNLANAKSPSAPVLGVDAPDDSTVVFKLAYPYAPFVLMMGYTNFMAVMPVEAADKYDVRQDVRGTGAWRLQQHVISSRLTYTKNPDWYNADKVNFDTVTSYVIPEYATGLAQFRNGALATYAVQPEDLIQTKKDLPNLLFRATEQFSRGANWLKYSLLPSSPFNDARVRQAVSMLIDRDTWIEALNNVQNFRNSGLDVGTRWHSAIPAGEESWLDPQGKNFGENARFYKYDPAGAKKLLAAAGFNGPVRSVFQWTPNGYGNAYIQEAQALMGMIQEHGDFVFTVKTPDYNSEWRPQVTYGLNQHEGLAYGGGGTSDPEVDIWLEKWYRGNINQSGWPTDPALDAKLDAQKREADSNKRLAMLEDVQRYVPGKMNFLLSPGVAQTFTLTQPWVGNAGLWRAKDHGSAANETLIYLWYDKSKKV